MEIFKEKMEGRVVRNYEEDKGKASGTMSWEGILVFSIERRVRKERDVQSEKESGEDVKQRNRGALIGRGDVQMMLPSP